jgi:hypothetical protein
VSSYSAKDRSQGVTIKVAVDKFVLQKNGRDRFTPKSSGSLSRRKEADLHAGILSDGDMGFKQP